MITSFELHKKLNELGQSGCTLLWLEGAKTEHVVSVKVSASRLVLTFIGGTSYLFSFERCVPTGVGLQFWNAAGRPGVLYRWEQLPKPASLEGQTHLAVHEPDNVIYIHEWPGGQN